MKEQTYDVVVVGGGHNGLVVAAYLTKAGFKVCVIEKQDRVGGAVTTRELTLPGFKHDPAVVMYALIAGNPILHRDELGLTSKYGFKLIYPERIFSVIFPDDRALTFYKDLDKTCESISQFSEKDADAYRKFCKATVDMRRAASVGMYSPPPSWGGLMSVLSHSTEGRDFMHVLFSSCLDIAEEWFESEQMKIAMCRYASEIMIGPREKGTGSGILFAGGIHSWGVPIPVGGAVAFTEALEAFIKDNGGTIRVSSPVKSIKVEGGVAKGAVLEDGEEVLAKKAVVSNVHVKQLFLDMMKADELPSDFRTKVTHLKRSAFSGMNQAIALREAPKYKAGQEVDNSLYIEFAPFMEEFLRAFDDLYYGITNTNLPTLVATTVFDPSRAPEGKHTLYLWNYEPYHLKNGGVLRWDEIKQEVADGILETVRQHTTNMGADNILGRWIMSPLDIPKYFPSMLEGDIGHIGMFITQLFDNRPIPGWGHYKTPIDKLYMTGASTHPGTGITGGGRATAQVILENLGIDFKKLVGK